jgi:hypothetical protein
MSSISDSAYLGNSYGQTYNSAGQFDIVSTSNLKVAGDFSVGGKVNGAMKTGFVTGYISGSVLEELTVDGGSASNNSRAFRTTSGAADLPTSDYADLTDAQKGSLLTLPLGAIPTSAILCTTDTTTDPFTGALAELSVSLTNNYDPNDDPDLASGGGNAGTELGAIYTGITGTNLNDTISVSSSATGPLVVNIPVETMSLNLSGGSGSCGGLTGGDDGVNTVVASVDTAIFTAAAELKIRINYVIAPTSTEFLSDNY